MKHVQNLKQLLDMAVARGLISSSDAARVLIESLDYVSGAVKFFEESLKEDNSMPA